jgi:beta-lactamase regulating signal transducer with metallopeptidase domain
MSLAGALAFNLLVNAAGSFLVGAAVALAAAWLFRLPEGRWRQVFLLMPLAKVAFDLAKGVPGGSFFWLALAGERQDRGVFRVDVGVERVVPVVDLGLGALRGGFTYAQSLADVIAAQIVRWSWASAPACLAAAALAVGSARLALRVARAAFALAEAERLRRASWCLERRAVGRRTVEVLIADGYDGVPFASGLRRPFVCLPGPLVAVLPLAEREAIIGHELAHLARHDLLLFAALGVLADLFWFVPGLGALCRAAREQSEIGADDAALAAGASPEDLASALVRVAEQARLTPAPALGLLRAAPLLARRVVRLAAAELPPSLSPGSVVARLLFAAWVFAIILRAQGCGNH